MLVARKTKVSVAFLLTLIMQVSPPALASVNCEGALVPEIFSVDGLHKLAVTSLAADKDAPPLISVQRENFENSYIGVRALTGKRPPRLNIFQASVSPDGSFYVATGYSGELYLFNSEGDPGVPTKVLHTVEPKFDNGSKHIRPRILDQGSKFAVQERGTYSILVFDRDGNLLSKISQKNDQASEFQLSPDGDKLALGYKDGTVDLIEISSGSVIMSLSATQPDNPSQSVQVTSINWHQDGKGFDVNYLMRGPYRKYSRGNQYESTRSIRI